MNDIINEIEVTEELPDWIPDRECKYAELTEQMEFIVSKLQQEEKEAEALQDTTNKLLAEGLFKKFTGNSKTYLNTIHNIQSNTILP